MAGKKSKTTAAGGETLVDRATYAGASGAEALQQAASNIVSGGEYGRPTTTQKMAATGQGAVDYVRDTANSAVDTVKGTTGIGTPSGYTSTGSTGGGLIGAGKGMLSSAQDTAGRATGAISQQIGGVTDTIKGTTRDTAYGAAATTKRTAAFSYVWLVDTVDWALRAVFGTVATAAGAVAGIEHHHHRYRGGVTETAYPAGGILSDTYSRHSQHLLLRGAQQRATKAKGVGATVVETLVQLFIAVAVFWVAVADLGVWRSRQALGWVLQLFSGKLFK